MMFQMSRKELYKKNKLTFLFFDEQQAYEWLHV